MARNERDNSNDLSGGRDSLGAVHPLHVQEEREAGMRMAEATQRWRRRNRRTHERAKFPLEEVLLMLGVKEKPSKAFQVKYAFRSLSMRSKHWFGRSDESDE